MLSVRHWVKIPIRIHTLQIVPASSYPDGLGRQVVRQPALHLHFFMFRSIILPARHRHNLSGVFIRIIQANLRWLKRSQITLSRDLATVKINACRTRNTAILFERIIVLRCNIHSTDFAIIRSLRLLFINIQARSARNRNTAVNRKRFFVFKNEMYIA